jgi:hypothetical protein
MVVYYGEKDGRKRQYCVIVLEVLGKTMRENTEFKISSQD